MFGFENSYGGDMLGYPRQISRERRHQLPVFLKMLVFPFGWNRPNMWSDFWVVFRIVVVNP